MKRFFIIAVLALIAIGCPVLAEPGYSEEEAKTVDSMALTEVLSVDRDSDYQILAQKVALFLDGYLCDNKGIYEVVIWDPKYEVETYEEALEKGIPMITLIFWNKYYLSFFDNEKQDKGIPLIVTLYPGQSRPLNVTEIFLRNIQEIHFVYSTIQFGAPPIRISRREIIFKSFNSETSGNMSLGVDEWGRISINNF